MPRRQRMTTSRAESAITTPRFRSARTQTESSGFNERSSSRLWSNHENQTDRRIYDLALEFLCYRARDCRHARSDSYGDEHCPTGLRACGERFLTCMSSVMRRRSDVMESSFAL